MKINFKKLLMYLGITLGVGALAAFFTMNSMDIYSKINRPALAPPSILFPIAWTILYSLMAISAYIVSQSDCENKEAALTSFYVQLAVNFVWPLIFFNLQAFLVSLLWLILLVALVIIMIIQFYRCKPISAYLQIPYLLWLLFATYLNFSIYIMN